MRPSFLIAALVLLSGCAGPGPASAGRYNASRNVTSFRSTAINLGAPIQGGSLGATRILLSADAECRGEGCTPTEFAVSLSKAGGSAAVSDYNEITFETPDGSVSFGDAVNADGSAQFYSVAQGEIVRLLVPTHIFRSFATSSTLTIWLGSSTYRLAYDQRAPLRRLLPAE